MSNPELHQLAMRAPIPTLAERARRARRILARMGVVMLLFGCGGPLVPRVQSALDILDCQVEAARDLVPSALVAEQTVLATRAGNVEEAIAGLLQLGMSVEEVTEVGKAIADCAR